MKALLSRIKHAIGLKSPLRRGYHLLRGVLAYALSGNPAKGMYIIGVTGTKGKTTTSTLIASALEADGKKVALFSTAQLWIAGHKTENQSKMTMDDPFKLWKLIRKAKLAGVTHIVLETSSHGIYYHRNFGIRYDAVLLTNISQDHLDLHGTMEEYAKTKARIFESGRGKIRVIPIDCELSEVFLIRARSTKFKVQSSNLFTYSMRSPANFRATHITVSTNGISIEVSETINDKLSTINSRLAGEFNAENMLSAFALLRSIGIDVSSIQRAWKDFTGVPGRLEPVPNTRGIHIFVDYAHTEQSLRMVLQALRASIQSEKDKGQKTGNIILVFGATGDRDTTKRPKMGQVAHELADVVVLTDDDPYTEPHLQIIDMIRPGIPRPIGETFQIIPDRREAIHWAIKNAKPGDIVILAGKGCETVQITNDGIIPWSDRGVVEEFLARSN